MSPSSGVSPLFLLPSPPPFGAEFRRAASSASRRLALRVDADVRVVLQHATGQVAADRFEQVIGDAHLGKFGDHRVPQIMESQAMQARSIPRAPGRVTHMAKPGHETKDETSRYPPQPFHSKSR